jgi:CMP-N,N'-diacetyllegionaminic acid synthase
MVLGVTPARGGSKGIPGKNIRLCCGKPLIAWTIEAAVRSSLLDRFVVSTEDAGIADTARSHGADVLDRPEALASDTATTLSVLQHVHSQVPADLVVLLQPTSPVRDPDLIDRCIRRLRESGADSLATGFICRFVEYGVEHRRQDVPGFFYDDGNVYIYRGELIAKGDPIGRGIERVLLDREQNVEVDDEFDLWLAEKVLERRAGRMRAG